MKNFRQLSKSVAEQKLTTEAKEKTEYDYEGDMARGQLQSVINNAQRVHDMLEDNDNLPEWVQSKITLAEDYISTVANYMMSEIDEETHQAKTTMKHIPNASPALKKAAKDIKPGVGGYRDRIDMLKAGGVKEEVDQIDELSNNLLGRYKTAAGADASKADKAGDYNKGNKRFGGIVKATNKQFANDMKKEEVVNEVMDEPNYKNSIQARQKKADDANKPPFDGPYSKTSSVTTDKSGAKHGPMSVARHLAKQAMQRQSASLKKPVKEQAMSNKAKIVKDAAKKKKTGESEDAFQSEPIMTKSPTKNY
jgi:predicted transcriptional regulator